MEMSTTNQRCQIITVRLKQIKRKRKVEITSLHCVDEILKWLPINDLYSISRTCKSLQKSAGLQYQRDFSNSTVTIELLADKRIQSQYEGKYDLHFSANIRNVTMTSYLFDQSPMPLFDYLKMNCCFNLKELNLLRLKCALTNGNNDYGASIKGQLLNLKIIGFDGCIIPDIHKQFLKHCQNLKHLRIKEKKFNVDSSDAWMRNTYKNLDSFTFWGCDDGKYSNLSVFLAINRQVKNINCMSIDVLKIIMENAKDLNNLVIHCEAPEDFDLIQKLLNQHSTLNVFKRFELVFHFTSEINKVPKNTKHIRGLKTLDQFQGFHGLFTMDDTLMDLMHSFDNLRSLSLKLVPEDEQNAWTLTEHLPQLDDLRIYIITYSLNQSRPTFMPLTKPFILESKKLKRLIVSFATNSCVTHRSDIVCLNNTRLQSKGACPTTIYLNNEVIVQSKFFMPAFGGLVQVKPTSQLTRNLYLDPFLF